MFFHTVNHLLQVPVFDFGYFHIVQACAMQIRRTVAGDSTYGRASVLNMGREPPMVQLGPSDFIVRKAGTAMRSIIVRLKNQSLHVRGKCTDDALLSVLRNYENIRPPPVSA